MHIISKEKDYYDTSLGHGVDKTSTYVRKFGVDAPNPEESAVFAELGYTQPIHINYQECGVFGLVKKEVTAYKSYVLVAGTAYPVWLVGRVSVDEINGNRQFKGDDLRGFANEEKLTSYYRRVMERSFEEAGYEPAKDALKVSRPYRYFYGENKSNEQQEKNFLSKDFTEWHLSHQAPVLLVVGGAKIEEFAGEMRVSGSSSSSKSMVVVTNPSLKNLGIPYYLDAYACFQKIEQFMTGVVPGGQMPMVELTDKSKILKKGFDPKYGFRRRPGT